MAPPPDSTAGGPGTTLVLGAGGYLGPRIVEAALARADARADAGVGAGPVVAASRRPFAGLARGRAGTRVASARPLDFLGAHAIERLLDETRPARVVLSAALARPTDCARDATRTRALNVDVPSRVARWTRAAGARLVSVSTDLVFGAQSPPSGGFQETDPVGPLHAYGRSKAEGEERVLDEDPAALVVRLPLLFGPPLTTEGGGAGSQGASAPVLAAVARGQRPRLFVDEWRTPLDVRDAARALVECLDLELHGRLHVAGPVRLSRFELGLCVLRAHGFAEQRAEQALRASTRCELGMDAERAQDVSLDAGLALRHLATPLRAPRLALADRAP